MQPKTPKLLEDVRDAASFIVESTRGMTFDEYRSNRLLYQAVERNFEVIGEALNRLAKLDPQTAARVDEHEQIIAFRNLLIHGYDLVDHERVWQIIVGHLPSLLVQVTTLLSA